MCSSCHDITGLVSFDNRYHTNTEIQDYIGGQGPTSSVVQHWNLTTSIEGGLSSSITQHSENGAIIPEVGSTFAAMGRPSPASESIDFLLAKSDGSTMNSTTSFRHDCNTTTAKRTWRCRGYSATRCELYPCIRTYTATMHNGRLEDKLVSTFSDWGDGWMTYGSGADLESGAEVSAILDTNCINRHERKSLETLGDTIKPT